MVADWSPEVAVIVAVPGATKATVPFATVATVASLVVQVTVLSVASAGVTVACNSTVLPTSPVAVAWLKAIPDTGTFTSLPPSFSDGVMLLGLHS